MTYQPRIGLEIHVQLATRTKAFCGCEVAAPGAAPNSSICEVCTGHPGALPVFNREVALLATKIALALGCEINPQSTFDRKNYFYPDLPKGYQITQFFHPLGRNGSFRFFSPQGEELEWAIRRVHIEEDAARLVYLSQDGFTGIDDNRSGIPLVEIVTEPAKRTPEQARSFFQQLRDTLRFLEVTSGDMEWGALRCDANVSVCSGDGVRCSSRMEVKNLNSFSFLQKALEFEIVRLQAQLESGKLSSPQTRGWDASAKRTFLLREKESLGEYRYFPEPDLGPVFLSPHTLSGLFSDLPELPHQQIRRYMRAQGLSYPDALFLWQNPAFRSFFEECRQLLEEPGEILKWLRGEIQGQLHRQEKEFSQTPLTPKQLVDLVKKVQSGQLPFSSAREWIRARIRGSEKPLEVLQPVLPDEASMHKWVEEVLEEHPRELEKYHAGKTGLLHFFMGQVLQKSKGKAIPEVVLKILRDTLGGKR
ncbi:MAG TPA: Asp-tRNA(Asn)/Glu-tRNA(Gln) amidotransferase subunit GatB [Thermotogota bacterium]|nr:Asp-tRNA(Asn)/Glu-tRNA(Gln) amidotransferase subunit GatB [Thermotogota bacterium]